MVAIRWNAFRSIARSLVWGLFLSLALGGGTAWAQATVVDGQTDGAALGATQHVGDDAVTEGNGA